MSKLIVEMEMPVKEWNCLDCKAICTDLMRGYYCGITKKTIDTLKNMRARPDWCPIKGVLPDEHGDLIDRHKTAEELNEMADEVYNDFPLVDRETLASWDHGIRMAAQYVQNLAGRKDAAERRDDDLKRRG